MLNEINTKLNQLNTKLNTLDKINSQLHSLTQINTRLTTLEKQSAFINELLKQSNSHNLGAIFNTIYKTNYWGKGSGPGSDASLCATYVEFLQEFFKQKQIKTVVDCGCGDWQFSQNIDFTDIDYKGFDVSSIVIDKNLASFKQENVNFILYDGDFDKLVSADLLICKDVLQHLPNAKIQEFIGILPRYKFALITNDTGQRVNADIASGNYRAIDLRQEPFGLDLKLVFCITRMPNAPDIAVMLWENSKFA
ncbi:class I SAM-dependent methyltransferase [Campylobacter troglodytis]|uniref:class I SAM-dependent methyltransferase n=1 Tax=Campylobacter troglodytis TaxID=654363 RepID=UPI001157391B|nr:class I SAM-dependent methyltransferase [Campylobacter troglodytis]TQR58149.1 hypothetical protein DMC01_08180 [Campylobacter troglodytis]